MCVSLHNHSSQPNCSLLLNCTTVKSSNETVSCDCVIDRCALASLPSTNEKALEPYESNIVNELKQTVFSGLLLIVSRISVLRFNCGFLQFNDQNDTLTVLSTRGR